VGVNRTNTDQFQLRLPPGLRDRIKAVAERRGTSINTEIVRVLEQRFPEQWPLEDRLEILSRLLPVLSAGRSDPRLDEFVDKMRETIAGIASGRVTGVDLETRQAMQGLWHDYLERESEQEYQKQEDAQMDYSEEEQEAFRWAGEYENYAEPPPKTPNPLSDTMFLMDVLRPTELAQITDLIRRGQVEEAAEVVRRLSPDRIKEKIEFLNLPVTEQLSRTFEKDGD